MLVDNVESVDAPEGLIAMPVWTGGAHDFLHRVGDALYVTKAGIYERLSRLVDRETGTSGTYAWPRPAVNDQLPRKQVQRGSKVMHHIPKRGCDSRWGRIDPDAHPLRPSAPIRLWLSDEFVRVGIAEACDPSLQLRDVLIGPGFFARGPARLALRGIRLLPSEDNE